MVEDDVDRPAVFQSLRQTTDEAAAESGDTHRHRRTIPAEYQSDLRLTFDQVESAKMFLDGLGDCGAVDLAAQIDIRPQHLQVFLRQQIFIGALNGVAAHLHSVLRRAHDRGADTLTRGRERTVQRSVAYLTPERSSHGRAEIAE